jgi:hypothetical protein
MTAAFCNSCIDVTDPRYNDDEGCIDGRVYGYCGDDLCGGLCEQIGRCDCQCHAAGVYRRADRVNVLDLAFPPDECDFPLAEAAFELLLHLWEEHPQQCGPHYGTIGTAVVAVLNGGECWWGGCKHTVKLEETHTLPGGKA